MPDRSATSPPSRFVAAVDLGGTRLRLRLADLDGVEIAFWSALLEDGGKTPGAVCRRIEEGLRACCRQAGVERGSVVHLTVGAPGITDARTGTIVAAPNLIDFDHVPLRDLLAQQTGLPVEIDNDTNLAALGEFHAGAARGVRDFIFLAVGTGLGAGLVLGGEVHAGAHGSAGEVGYLSVRGAVAVPPRVLQTGRLEDEVGGGGIERRWQQALAAQGLDGPELLAMRAGQIFDLTVNPFSAADAGAAQAAATAGIASEVLQTTAVLLADAITAMALVLDPQMVVLGGGIGSHPALAPAVATCLGENEFARPEVRRSELGAEAGLAGGIAVSLAALSRHFLS